MSNLKKYYGSFIITPQNIYILQSHTIFIMLKHDFIFLQGFFLKNLHKGFNNLCLILPFTPNVQTHKQRP